MNGEHSIPHTISFGQTLLVFANNQADLRTYSRTERGGHKCNAGTAKHEAGANATGERDMFRKTSITTAPTHRLGILTLDLL